MGRVVAVRRRWSGGGSAAVGSGCWPPMETSSLPGKADGWWLVAWGPKRLMRAAVREVPLTAGPAGPAAAPCRAVAAGRVAAGALRGRWAAASHAVTLRILHPISEDCRAVFAGCSTRQTLGESDAVENIVTSAEAGCL
ncbi:MAG: hypothetical protein WDW36_006394 [Sanguina aurantia]